MTNTLRSRIATALAEAQEAHNGLSDLELADAVIRELPELTALRRCERCRLPYRPDEYPPMRDGADELRPFCIRCTNYIEWATS